MKFVLQKLEKIKSSDPLPTYEVCMATLRCSDPLNLYRSFIWQH